MEPEQSERLEHILGQISAGVVILDCTDLRFLYANSYFLSLLDQPWRSQGVIGSLFDEVVADEVKEAAVPSLRQVCSSGQSMTFPEIPYEGFLETRGRTYWRISIEPSPQVASPTPIQVQPAAGTQPTDKALQVIIEDVTDRVRSRLHLEAIHHVSSAIAGQFALPQVLDRILQAVQELVGSTRCAIFLIDYPISDNESHVGDFEEQIRAKIRNPTHTAATVTVAAQKGLHLDSQDWHPQVSEKLLLGQVMRSRRSLIIPDTSTRPEIEFPLLDDNGTPRRPGSAVCVPILVGAPLAGTRPQPYMVGAPLAGALAAGAVLGTIEVYHRRARGLPVEEVELLEQFAQQAGLAIQNARLFLRVDRLARMASQQARQRENIMQAIPDGVIIYDAHWRVADVNNAIRKLLGWSEDVIGLHVSEALARSTATFPLNSPSISDLVAELEQHPWEKRVDEFKMVGADGLTYTIRRSKAPIQDEPGNIFAFVVVYHDVTDQAIARERIEAEVIARTAELAQRNQALQDAQAALELESARLELLVGRLPSGVLLISANDNRIIVGNRRAAQLLQRMGAIPANGTPVLFDEHDVAAKEITGMNIEELLRSVVAFGTSGSVIPYEQQPLYLALHDGEASEAEVYITQTDGQTLFLLVNAAPLRANDGTITNAVLVWQDITRLKALERAREDFFTTMAHELKTPLANIRAHLSALQAEDFQWSTEEQLDFLETADEQVERLVGMINHFLDASRVEAGALRLELEPILLPEMFEDLQDRLEALISSSHRQLEIDAPTNLPAVLADYELIMSVLSNLLSNAFRFAPEGDIVRLEAETVFAAYDDQPSPLILPEHAVLAANKQRLVGWGGDGLVPTGVEIRVIDRGPGITEERQTELFTRFSTFAALRRPAANRPGQPITEKRRGNKRWSPATGLGLYISRGIIEAHGSVLRLKSSPGQGASFAFTLAIAGSFHKEV